MSLTLSFKLLSGLEDSKIGKADPFFPKLELEVVFFFLTESLGLPRGCPHLPGNRGQAQSLWAEEGFHHPSVTAQRNQDPEPRVLRPQGGGLHTGHLWLVQIMPGMKPSCLSPLPSLSLQQKLLLSC